MNINIEDARDAIASGQDLSRQRILAQTNSLKRNMATLSQEMVAATLNGILVKELARLLLAYDSCLEAVSNDEEQAVVVEAISEEFQESSEELVEILAPSRAQRVYLLGS